MDIRKHIKVPEIEVPVVITPPQFSYVIHEKTGDPVILDTTTNQTLDMRECVAKLNELVAK
jgi:hypothetical protein